MSVPVSLLQLTSPSSPKTVSVASSCLDDNFPSSPRRTGPAAAVVGAASPPRPVTSTPPDSPVHLHCNVLRQQSTSRNMTEGGSCVSGRPSPSSASASCCRQCSRRAAVASSSSSSFRRLLHHHCLTYHVILYSLQILLLFSVACQAIITDDLVVETTKGKIRGVTLKSATNR